MTPLAIGQERSIRLIDDVVAGDRLLALVTAQRRARSTRPAGTTSTTSARSRVVHKMIKVPDGTLRILVRACTAIRLDHRIDDDPYLRRRVRARCPT